QRKKLAGLDVQPKILDDRQVSVLLADAAKADASALFHEFSAHFAHSLPTSARFFAHHFASIKKPCWRVRSPPGILSRISAVSDLYAVSVTGPLFQNEL